MRETWTFHTPGKILFGRGAIKKLGEICARMGAGRVLVITDPILEKAGLVDQVRQPLLAANLNVEVFTGGEPEPSFRAADACVQLAKASKPDLLIGLGGGSNMDLAKLCATLLAHGGTPHIYLGDEKVPGPILPLICIPTTAGTGSEVSAAAVLTDTENKMKVAVLSNYLRPRVALVDPMLTVGCPAKVSADSGIDALTHAIEAYTAIDNAEFPLPEGEQSVYQGRHPLGDITAERAISLVGKFLARAVKDGNDLEAREGMALGAMLAGMAFSNVGVALVHAMEYPVGGAVHISHGAGNGLLLPYVMRFNLPGREKAFARIASLLGVDISRMSEAEAAKGAISAVEKLSLEIGIPQKLREVGVRAEMIPAFADKAAGVKRILRVNPRPVSVEDIKKIYQEAL